MFCLFLPSLVCHFYFDVLIVCVCVYLLHSTLRSREGLSQRKQCGSTLFSSAVRLNICTLGESCTEVCTQHTLLLTQTIRGLFHSLQVLENPLNLSFILVFGILCYLEYLRLLTNLCALICSQHGSD